MIEIIGLHKTFGKHHVLKGVDLTIPTGQTMVIIGRSGCGKSVLLKHIVGLIKPDEGQILIDGEDITTFEEGRLFRLRQRFGMLFQGAALFDSLTVEENVGLALREHTDLSRERIREVVREKLASVGMADVEQLTPAELSGGMRKRVGLARALAMDPEIILYDEPTTGLDPIMADAINQLIVRMKRQLSLTSIAVTHDMVSAYKITDRIAMLHEGRIIFEGTVEEIRETDDPVVQQFIQGEAEGPIKAV